MPKYIDKEKIVAEIERRISLFQKEKKTEKWSAAASQMNVISLGARVAALEEFLSFLDTLEVKEVDLEKEIQTLWSLNQKSADSLFIPMNYNGLHGIAKHFYELGLKAQKGE